MGLLSKRQWVVFVTCLTRGNDSGLARVGRNAQCACVGSTRSLVAAFRHASPAQTRQ
ncbi:MAG: hypothetical protein H8E62_05285 [Planctomycetes bacterium]|nr:hypothetical protein [Planctomycetota bacterium]